MYVVALESLVKERMVDWGKKFGEGLGLSVVELTGTWGGGLEGCEL